MSQVMSRSKRLVPYIAALAVIAASVVLVGVSGTAALALVAWMRSGSALSGRNFAN